ncbi:MAG: hypothetical protein ING59_19375 [Burkholderiales bacterium]|nr:hypothetical protein [Burkholderiales bacterium]
MTHSTHQGINEPLHARVGRQIPLHGTLVPLHRAERAPQDPQPSRSMTIAMAALALVGVVALGAQLLRAAAGAPPAPTQTNAQNVGAELAAALHSRAASSPAADAAAGANRPRADARRP